MQVITHIHACQWLQDVVMGELLPRGEAAILDKVSGGIVSEYRNQET